MDAGIGILAIMVGLMSCFFGYPLFRVMLIFAGFIGGYLIGQSFVQTGHGWLAFLSGITAGIIMALFAYPLWSVGVFVIGAALGIIILSSIAIILNTSLTVMIVLAVIVAGLMGFLFYQVRDFFVMLTTGFYGAVEIVYGAGYFIPILSLRHGSPNFFALAAVILLSSIGFLLQYHLFKDRQIYSITP